VQPVPREGGFRLHPRARRVASVHGRGRGHQLAGVQTMIISWILKTAAPVGLGIGFLALVKAGDANSPLPIAPIKEASPLQLGDDGAVVIDGQLMVRL